MKNLARAISTKMPLWQFIKFNLVGIVNTAVDFCLFAVLHWLGVHTAAAQTLSYSGGLLNSFIMNKRWTFAQRKSASAREITAFVLVNLVSLGCSIVLIDWLHQALLLPVLLSKLIATAFTVIVNFVGYRRWVFPRK